MSYAVEQATRALGIPSLIAMKQAHEKIVVLTAYDASFAARVDAAGVDVVLVGDSLGMVIQGERSTLPVTVEHMLYHCRAVSRAVRRAVVMADLPFLSFATPERALDAAGRLLAEAGASMVKLEGAGPVIETTRFLVEREVPVCAHLGLTPQSVLRFGGFKAQAKQAEAQAQLRADAKALQQAGASLLVLECVPADFARSLSAELAIPVIGIGAGAGCDGQVLVLYDMLGITTGRRPRFSKDFLAEHGSIDAALAAYVADVRAGRFPAPEHEIA